MDVFKLTKPSAHKAGDVCRIPLTDEERRVSDTPPKMSEITWRIFRIMAEFVEGFQFLSTTKKEVTIFGSHTHSTDEQVVRRCRSAW